MSEEKKEDLKFLTSIAVLVLVDEKPCHVQISIFEDESKKVRLYYDVIDPSKAPKIAE